MEDKRLFDGELKFMSIVWDSEPLSSRELVEKCAEALGWKQSTTYTVPKKLSKKGFVKNEGGVVTSVIGRDEARAIESGAVVDRGFSGSLPSFVAAFVSGRGLSDEEADELLGIIDAYRRGEK